MYAQHRNSIRVHERWIEAWILECISQILQEAHGKYFGERLTRYHVQVTHYLPQTDVTPTKYINNHIFVGFL